MPWLIIAIASLVGLAGWEAIKSASTTANPPAPGPQPAAPPVTPAPPAPLASGGPATTGPATAPMVTLTPGNLGTLQMPSWMASGNNLGVGVQPPQSTATGALQALITNVNSSNTAVIDPSADLAGPAQGLGRQNYPVNQFGMAVRGPGTTTLTITWTSAGAPTQISTLIVTVPP